MSSGILGPRATVALSSTRNAEDDDVSDDENGEVIRRTDLSDEVHTERAVYRYRLTEKAMIKASKTGFEVSAESSPGSSQNKALTTFYLVGAIGVMTGIAWAIGIPAIAALVTGLSATIGIYLLVHFTPGGQTRE
jgi:hypothetical protein